VRCSDLAFCKAIPAFCTAPLSAEFGMSPQGKATLPLATTHRIGAIVASRRTISRGGGRRVASQTGRLLNAFDFLASAWATCRALCAAAAARLAGGELRPIEGQVRAAPEVARASRLGYDICFRQAPPSKRFVRYAFVARRQGREVGRLDVDFIGGEKRLYTQNIFVAEAHRKRGLAAALLVSAAKTTECAVLTTSARTADGVPFFDGMRPILKRHHVELSESPA
jgi:hypothetical protein